MLAAQHGLVYSLSVGLAPGTWKDLNMNKQAHARIAAHRVAMGRPSRQESIDQHMADLARLGEILAARRAARGQTDTTPMPTWPLGGS